MSVTLTRSPYRKLPSGGVTLIRRPPGNTVPAVPSAPATPNTPSPATTATALYTLLTWVSSGQAWADIYLSTTNPPTAVTVAGYVGTSYVPTLLPGTTYYWKIVASNAGGSSTGPVWSFTTPAATTVIFTIAGTVFTHVRWRSLTIHDAINAAPNTAELLVDTTAPTVGQDVQIGLSSLDAADLLFAGTIQTVEHSYEDVDGNRVWPVTLVDYTFSLNKRRPFGTYVSVSATAIAKDLVARYAVGFTSTHVQEALAAISINFDGSEDVLSCLGRLATAVGGYCDVDYGRDVHLFLTEATEAPDPLDQAHPPLNDPPITFSTDLSQIRTEVLGKGHGEAIPCDVLAGEPILPLPDTSLFPFSGLAVAGTTADGAQTQMLTYTGTQAGGVGSLAGPGAAPSSAPTLTLAGGTGLGIGTYQYAYTDITPSGESLPSPIGTVVTSGTLADPTTFPNTATFDAVGAIAPDGARDWAYTWMDSGGGETLPSPHVTRFVVTGLSTAFTHPLALGPSGTTARRLYRTAFGGATLLLVATINDNTTLFYRDAITDSSLGAAAPSSNTTSVTRVSVSAIAIGASPTTDRKLYRTAVGGSQLKLLTTIAGNVTTTYADSTADGSLGANAPTSDTSGLTQPSGQINAGSTSLLTASPGPFSTSGGWVVVGGNVIRYTGISGNTLTGIVASGSGAIVNTILYGEHVIASPALTGINANNGLPIAMAKGSVCHVLVQRENLAGQAALAILEGGDGIRQYMITDERRGSASLTALCDADLAIFSRPIVGATYASRDPKTRSGKTVSIDLHAGFYDAAFYDPAFYGGAALYGLAGDFTIQSVDITFDAPRLLPRYTVQASSVAFTLSDLLRRVVLAA